MKKIDNDNRNGSIQVVDKYSTDILHNNSVAKEIIEHFATVSKNIWNIDYSNSEGYSEAFHKRFQTLSDFRLFEIPDDVIIDYVTFDFSIENNNFVAVLSYEDGTISIWRFRNVNIDFLPFLNDMEQKIQQKKNNGLKM